MSRLRSRLQRLEQQASSAGMTQNIGPEDLSWLFEPHVPPPSPVDVVQEQASKGNFTSLERARAMIASTESPPGC